MRVIKPVSFVNSMLVSSTVSEPDTSKSESTFNLASSYLKGQRAILGSPSSAVTISNASPAVVGWANHGLADGTPVVLTNVVGALPAGLTSGGRYFVVNSTTSTFQVSDALDGPALSTTSSGLGTHTATAEVHRVYESQKGTSAPVVSISNANPAVITINEHGKLAGTPVTFSTTGALPSGLTAGTLYYVVNPGLSTFNVSLVVGGTPVATSSAGSGAHTAVFNPNIGNPPLRDDGVNWVDVGPTNKWAMFDLLRNSRTYGASPLTVVVKPGQRVDSLGLLGLIGDQVTFTVSTPGQPNITETIGLVERELLNWDDYYYMDFSDVESMVRLNLNPYTGSTLAITVTRANGQCAIGGVIAGMQFNIGDTQYEAQPDLLNFSKIARDAQGNSELIPRRTVPSTQQNVRFEKDNTKAILDKLRSLAAVPALWVGIDDGTSGYFEAVLIFGIYTRAQMNLDLYTYGMLSLALEEV